MAKQENLDLNDKVYDWCIKRMARGEEFQVLVKEDYVMCKEKERPKLRKQILKFAKEFKFHGYDPVYCLSNESWSNGSYVENELLYLISSQS